MSFAYIFSLRSHRLTRPTASQRWIATTKLAIAISASLAATLFATPSQAAGSDGAAAETATLNIVSLASARLSNTLPIAQWKWQQKLPIEDKTEETFVLKGMLTIAPRYGIDPSFASNFLNDQMLASRQMQTALFAEWRTKLPPALALPSLESARSENYRITQEMLSGLAQLQGFRSQSECPIVLSRALKKWTTEMTTLDDIQKAALATALSHVCSNGGIGGTA